MNDVAKLINSLRESFLVHSYLYYTLQSPICPDNLFDSRAKYLNRLQKEHPEVAEKCIYADYFSNFNPGTGMDAPVDDWVKEKAAERLKNKNS